jgi:hypothetical protein
MPVLGCSGQSYQGSGNCIVVANQNRALVMQATGCTAQNKLTNGKFLLALWDKLL